MERNGKATMRQETTTGGAGADQYGPEVTAQHRHNLRQGVVEGVLATPWVFLSLPGNFLISGLLTQYYGIEVGLFGLIASLPAWANAAQILLIPGVSRFLSARDLTLGMSWWNLGLWFMLVLVMHLAPGKEAGVGAEAAGALYLQFFLLATLSASLIGVGWTSWVQEWVPGPVRSKYFGRRNGWIQAGNFGFLVLAVALLRAGENALWPFQVILGVAVGMRFLALLWQHTIHGPERMRNRMVHADWWSQFRKLGDYPGLTRYMGFVAWVGFWLGFSGPFGPVFIYSELGKPPFTVGVLVILASLGAAVTTPAWGRIAETTGSRWAIGFSLLFWQGPNFLWCFLTPENSWILYPMWLAGGATSAGWLLCSFVMLLKQLPDEIRTAGVSAHLAFTSVAAGLAPILAGGLLMRAEDFGVDRGTVYRWIFAATPAAILAGLATLRFIPEKGAIQQSFALGAMRTLRHLMIYSGLSGMVNVVLFRKGKD